MDTNASRVHRQHALAAYVEPLATGRRVAVFGDASLGLAARIAELGARSVHLWDPDATRALREAERAPQGVVVSALPPLSRGGDRDELGRAFDLVVIPDMELFDDIEGLLARVRRLAGDVGAVLVAAPNRDGAEDPEGFDYYELFDLVASQFDDVAMIAQLPFYGVALAELREDGDESPAVTVDMQLAGPNRSPEAFIALASQRGVRLDPYAIIELAPPPLAAAAVDEVEATVVALARVATLEVQLAELRAQVLDMELSVVAGQGLEAALRDRSLRVLELEGALAQRSRQFEQLLEEAAGMREAMQAEAILAEELEDLLGRAERAELALAALQPDVARTAELHASELARYEEALRDRAQLVRALEGELVRRERMVGELVDALAEAGQTGAGAVNAPDPVVEGVPAPDDLFEANARLRSKLDALALDLARREGEARAGAWTIAELERRLAQADEVSRGERAQEPDRGERAQEPDRAQESDSEVKRQLASALDELDVLRRALAQEHETRLRAESAKEPSPPTAAHAP